MIISPCSQQGAGRGSNFYCGMPHACCAVDWLTDWLTSSAPAPSPALSTLFLWLFVVVYVASMLISGVLFYGKLIKIARPPQQQQRQQSNIFIYLFSFSLFSNSFCFSFSLCCLMANLATWPACGATSASQQNNKRNSKTIGATRSYLNIFNNF